MMIIGEDELRNKASEILHRTAKHNIIITSKGKPIALMVKFTEDDLFDYILLKDPELRAGIEQGIKEADEGKLTPIDDVIEVIIGRYFE
jgi:antitoxin (DNA-binding transcriptional repressor) of toxin-antitoxin stability system